MAQLIIDFPDAIAVRMRDAFCAKTGWDGSVTKTQWVKNKTAEWIKNICVAQEADTVGHNAYTAQLATSQVELDIT